MESFNILIQFFIHHVVELTMYASEMLALILDILK